MGLNLKNIFQVYKNIGETPLVALERLRGSSPELKDLPMTYAGRLDPMAEGVLIILAGEECKNKEKYLNLDKEYEVEIVFGINTDSYDALGLAEIKYNYKYKRLSFDLSKYVGKFKQQYPAYSAKTFEGVQLHKLARDRKLPEEMPEKDVEIYSIGIVDSYSISSNELMKIILEKINLVRGDFRQEKIKAEWRKLLCIDGDSKSNNRFGSITQNHNVNCEQLFEVLKVKVKCSSGTYMRSLANKIGNDLDIGAFALSIKRTRFFKKSLKN
ncbi:MAG: hypothetical protein WC666_02110 [Candidatus Paceibacterota bacterium]|jgi:tRNA pseudouridine55 synthase